MDRAEFKKWACDFRARFPASGDWLINLPEETRDVWFEDVFSLFDLADCLQVNRELMRSGEIEAYQREKIPTVFMRRCQEIAYEREQVRVKRMLERRKAQRSGSFHDGLLQGFSPCMLQAYSETLIAMQDARSRGEPMTDSEVCAYARELMDRYDTATDDELSRPTYKCLTCCDSGYVSFDDEQRRRMVGHCDCEAGIKRRDAWRASGRSLARASANRTVEWDIA